MTDKPVIQAPRALRISNDDDTTLLLAQHVELRPVEFWKGRAIVAYDQDEGWVEEIVPNGRAVRRIRDPFTVEVVGVEEKNQDQIREEIALLDKRNAEAKAKAKVTLTPSLRSAIDRIGLEAGLKLVAADHQDRETSPEVAAIAARGIQDPQSLTPDEIKSVCASALSQRENP